MRMGTVGRGENELPDGVARVWSSPGAILASVMGNGTAGVRAGKQMRPSRDARTMTCRRRGPLARHKYDQPGEDPVYGQASMDVQKGGGGPLLGSLSARAFSRVLEVYQDEYRGGDEQQHTGDGGGGYGGLGESMGRPSVRD